ncbi:uncharacterized protein LOC130205144 isoform X3 [Pseudoliparis swirei]|uniref:uncharacterized protein LOC130205144 isoform X3 n=1 Tax=Pseudoliparis swirei TaxID=2059687 RepID=UPI0024BD7E22|nr:uncharacterized protein LOC130205144 isoform X3 [Pseudoliparis swirei]
MVPGFMDPGFMVPGFMVPGFMVPGFMVPGFMVPGIMVPGFMVPGFMVPGFMVPGFMGGPTYGRKMMTGSLAAAGVFASESRVGAVLRNIHPPYHKGARNLNPLPYHAAYVGHKIHMDQNEKIVMFGVTHVLAIDRFSSKIVGQATMPVKNNLTIYNDVYRSAVMEYGMWDQVRVDHGKEFYLTLFMQEKLASHRHNTEKATISPNTIDKE